MRAGRHNLTGEMEAAAASAAKEEQEGEEWERVKKRRLPGRSTLKEYK